MFGRVDEDQLTGCERDVWAVVACPVSNSDERRLRLWLWKASIRRRVERSGEQLPSRNAESPERV